MARRLPIPNGRLDGALDANGMRIVNLMDPMSGDDAATKAYVDRHAGGGGGGGTGDYNDLSNKPKINGHVLGAESTLDDIGAQKKLKAGANVTIGEDGTISASGGGSVVESEKNHGYAANADMAEVAGFADMAERSGSSERADAVSWDGIDGKPTGFDPSAHAGTHAANGADPISPESIGALPDYGGTVNGNLVVTQVLSVSDGALVAQRTGPGPSDVSVTKGGKEVATKTQVEAVDAKAAYPMLTMVNGAAKDRTVNISPNGGTITFPARTGDNVRDFVVRVSLSDTAPSIIFPSDVNYESDQDDCWTADAGKANEWYFSESEPDLFKVMHKALSPVAQ